MYSYDIEICPCDHLNPQCGYHIKIRRGGKVILKTTRHPITWKELDLAGALQVAGMYTNPNNKATVDHLALR